MLQDGQKLLATTKDTSVALGDTLKIVDAKPFGINEYKRTAELRQLADAEIRPPVMAGGTACTVAVCISVDLPVCCTAHG
jgi:hypothetical protein